jgi:hypothetical protein
MPIYDTSYLFVTVGNLRCSFHEEDRFVTNSSQKKLNDDFGVFNDEMVGSLMSTSLLQPLLKIPF